MNFFPMKPHSLENNTNTYFLTLPTPCISENCIETKIKLNLYFHTSL